MHRHLLAKFLALFLFASPLPAATIYLLTSDGKLATSTTAAPSTNTTPVTVTGVTAGETLVGIDVRPQNQQLYALGVNATANTATLYHVSPETAVANVVGTAGSVVFTTDGATPVDFPDPVTVHWELDFNPAADRLRVVAGSLNFRVDPNTGLGQDGNNNSGTPAGTNPDGAINGSGSTAVSGTAYTNNQPNNGNITTLYTLDSALNSLFIQNLPNSGTQTLGLTVTLGGNTLDFNVLGFDILDGVNAVANNSPVAAGSGFAVLNVGGTTGLYVINLVTGGATFVGTTLSTTTSMAIATEVPAAVALSFDGASLVRFSPTTPGTTTTQAISGVSGTELLVGIDFRPATGQLYAFGVNAGADFGTLYRLDPQTGVATAIGSTGQIAFVTAAAAPVDFPTAGSASYGFAFNPTIDRIRVTTSTGLNFRLNPITGAPVDGDLGGAAGSVAGINTDGSLNGANATAGAAAYTNSFGGATTTTLYTLDAVANTLCIQSPPNAGTQVLVQTVTLGGSPLDFTATSLAFDIPSAVSVTNSNTPAVGSAWAALTVGGVTGIYQIDLVTGKATSLGTTVILRGLALAFVPPEITVEAPTGTPVADAAATLSYGDLLVGQTSSVSVTVRNAGNGTLTYGTSFTSGANYVVTSGGAGQLGPRQTAVLQVTFAPLTGGSFPDTLHILSADADEASFDVSLTGKGLDLLAADAFTSTMAPSRLLVLANDGLSSGASITQASSGIQIDATGRALIIPAGFTGTITYDTDDGELGRGSVTVTAGTPVTNPKIYSGALRTTGDLMVGSATATVSTKGIATIQFRAGIVRASAKFDVSQVGGTTFAYTALGFTGAARNADGTITIFIAGLGGNISGNLRPCALTATAAKHHIAIATFDGTPVGGGTAIATVGKTGAIKIAGTLVDGLPFTAATNLRDDGSFIFFTAITAARPNGTLAGEFQTANLTSTDVTGEVIYFKPPQLTTAKGTEKAGVSAILSANGCKFDGTALLPAGSATLFLGGGALDNNFENNAVTINASGIPNVIGSLKTWTGVAKKVGKFSVTVKAPGSTKPVKGSGLYLPKSKTAWGYFPGATIGGRIQLTVP